MWNVPTVDESNPEFASLKRATLPVQAAEAIQVQIEAGAFQPNQLLPSERALAESFNVSRTAIREAIQLLQAKGFVDVRQGKGSFVVDPAKRSASSVATWMGGASRPLQKMVELRRIIEPGIAELAAENASASDVHILIGLAEDLGNCDRSDLSSTDAEFHREIARMTGNELVAELLSAALDLSEPLRQQTLRDRGGRKLAAEGHMKIARAIADGSAEGARKAMLDHLSDASRSIE